MGMDMDMHAQARSTYGKVSREWPGSVLPRS